MLLERLYEGDHKYVYVPPPPLTEAEILTSLP